MKKLNKKGFALVETLIVSVFVVSLFTLIYINFFPIMGEYEKREGYDDIDSVYKTYNIKKMFEVLTIRENIKNQMTSSSFKKIFDCGNCYENSDGTYKSFSISDVEGKCITMVGSKEEDVNLCKYLVQEEKIVEIYLSHSYELTSVKDNRSSYESSVSSDVLDYIDNQPFYKKDKKSENNKCDSRIVVKYINQFNNGSSVGYRSSYSYATIGVGLLW